MSVEIQEQKILAPYTTFKIGGPADYFVIVKTPEECVEALTFAHEKNIPFFILGGGSDILIADEGYRGLVIKNEMNTVNVDEERGVVTASAGVRLAQLIMQSARAGLSGLEYAIGVPATVGGAVWANLGARGSQMQDVVLSVEVVNTQTLEHKTLSNAECSFKYRDSIFKHEKWMILQVTFQLVKQPKAEVLARVQELTKLRKDTQDVGSFCAGCVFKNPTEQTDKAAAFLIDSLGLKGFQIGGAQVSSIHANFIINTGNATAKDVIMLISLIKQKVRDNLGVQLMEEIEYIGF
ncbi:MAG: UDP-N-acetylmuramate dehydrogenase [Candidatus Kerfeldbacteria bacterium]|nr:UDP-N-acetylmuramate dehydrogenase [Candidatus Kerfeldbacteria bacterium]